MASPTDDFKGTIGRTLADSEPHFDEPSHPKKGSPNVVFILLDLPPSRRDFATLQRAFVRIEEVCFQNGGSIRQFIVDDKVGGKYTASGLECGVFKTSWGLYT